MEIRTIGFIGLGIMGAPMSSNIAAKFDGKVLLCNRTHEKAQRLAQELSQYGAEAVEDKKELARRADLIITMVPRTVDSEAVYEEILPELGAGKICVDMSTIDPGASKEIAGKIKQTGAQFADAPVVKSKAAAIAGKLGIYVGCDVSLYETILPILQMMGENVIRMGANGNGLVMKICHNALASQIQNGVNETLTLAGANGIDPETYVRAISYGGAQNAYLDNHAAMFAKDEYPTSFSLQNAAKDVGIAVRLAKECGVPMPGEEVAYGVYQEALEKGLGPEDWGATWKIVRGRA